VKIEIAKDVILDLLDNLAEDSLVGFRTFGGCGSSRLVAPIAALQRDSLKAEVESLGPGGATPLALALEMAKGDFEAVPDPKLILLVSDGVETCDGDPVAAAKDLLRAGYDLRIHVVGFDIGQNADRDQLIEIARSTGGLYYDARSSEELRRALSIVAPFSYTVYDEEGNVVFEGRIGQDGPSLPAGTYTVVIDTSPPITLTGVVVQGQSITLITLEQANGGYHAEVGK
jgi:Ca-activated chloride channel family protein